MLSNYNFVEASRIKTIVFVPIVSFSPRSWDLLICFSLGPLALILLGFDIHMEWVILLF